MTQAMAIPMAGGGTLPGLRTAPADATACLVLAHGAGAGMRHQFMAALADGLAGRRLAVLRYDFPSMAQGARRPDSPKVATAAVRAAIAAAAATDLPLFAGGKSFGGRMTSLAQAEAPLPGVRGLVFVGFPLHPAKAPAIQRAAHLADVAVPMLFLQGRRDALAEPALITAEVVKLGPRATLAMTEDADHSFHVPKRSGRTDAEVMDAMIDRIAGWIGAILQPPLSEA